MINYKALLERKDWENTSITNINRLPMHTPMAFAKTVSLDGKWGFSHFSSISDFSQ